jgi:hypothetical protein
VVIANSSMHANDIKNTAPGEKGMGNICDSIENCFKICDLDEARCEKFCDQNQGNVACDKYFNHNSEDTNTEDNGIYGGLGPLCKTRKDCEIFCESNQVKCIDFCTEDESEQCEVVRKKYGDLDLDTSARFAGESVSPWVGEPNYEEELPEITIHLPFSLDSVPEMMIPMGEKIFHPNTPGGHPGIDFNWQFKGKVITPVDGVIKSMRQIDGAHTGGESWDIYINHGPYYTRYEGVEVPAFGLKVGAKLVEGDIIGESKSVHWEFGAAANKEFARGPTRFCPLGYLTPESREKIVFINTGSQWEGKTEWPDVCSGFYANVNELADYQE